MEWKFVREYSSNSQSLRGGIKWTYMSEATRPLTRLLASVILHFGVFYMCNGHYRLGSVYATETELSIRYLVCFGLSQRVQIKGLPKHTHI
jgi:hypothetical protein